MGYIIKTNKLMHIFIILSLLLLSAGCYSNNVDSSINDDSYEVINSMKIVINEKEYAIDLEDNETVKKFTDMLPQKLEMQELNGNEKYVYLDYSLPTNSANPKHINAGDVMLFGDNCLVIFYESFDTNYSYTKIGHIDNLPDLGSDDVIVSFIKG